MNVLEARGICKSYGRHQVLAGADLAITAGEVAAVVGENGSGKSTLLRILAGDLQPDAGRVRVTGRLGYCPQAAVLDDALSVDQHIRYFQAAYRIHAGDRAEALISRLGYAGFRHQPAGTLSGGTRQKLSLTLALLHNPALLLLDEPYQGFDWETYQAFWALAAELRTAGTAILIITHLVFEQQRLDRVWHLAGGRVTNEESSHAPAA
ncbi:MAG TPA: ABC transporter ATP-binding protein [Streptosporangiaceae bacterium]|jgi:ABC-type multidrug transport system ATPase subunit